MDKEFEALKFLYNDLRLMKCLDVVEEAKVKSAYECLEQALLELKQIKEAKPSEALDYMKSLFKCWEYLVKKDNKDNLEIKEIELEKYIFKEYYDTLKQALIKSQEQEKVLEIIWKKPFASASTINYININRNNSKMLDYEHYCMTIDIKYRVNEEEFELLKRWCEKCLN